jgi:hypothetical protein
MTDIPGDAAMTAPTPAQTQHRHDAGDLVTEEMVDAAFEAWYGVHHTGNWRGAVEAALRAVAPMIAARAAEFTDICGRYRTAVRAAEREACAQVADDFGSFIIAKRIRAKAPGEIDWSAMDKED